MSTFDSTKLPLRDVIAGIKKGEYQLPDFQRGWVWNDEHVRSLLVSISRSFPIGAVMTLETGGEVHFQVRPIENVVLDQEVEPEKLILDGQQRLTSLTQVLGLKGPVKTFDHKKSEIERYYYIDIPKVLNGSDIDEAFYSVSSDKTKTSDFGRQIDLDLTTLEKEVEALQFPCNRLLDYDSCDEWQDLCYDTGKRDQFKEFKKLVISPVREYSIPVIGLNKHTSKEAVCLVFEKVNTGGVSLTVFELITASFAANGFNLREDWYGDRRAKKQGRYDRLKGDKLLKPLTPTDFIQTITLLNTYEKNMKARAEGLPDSQLPGVSCKRKTMLNLTLQEYLNWATKVEEAFTRAAQFLRKECLFDNKNLPYRTQLVPLAAIMTHLGQSWLEPKVYRRLSQWYWCGVMGELYGSAIENRFANDIEDFFIWMEDEDKKPSTVFDASFQPSRLETLRTRNSAAYKGLHVLTLRQGAKDLFWKADVQELDQMGEALDIHHIFPSNWCDKNGFEKEVCDSAVNKTPISYKANRKIGGAAPSKYLDSLQNDKQVGLTDLEMDQLLESHFIDPGALRTDDFQTFLRNRSIGLLEVIYAAMGKGDTPPEKLTIFGLTAEEDRAAQREQKLAGGETSMVEFKSTLRWNIRANMIDKTMEEIILKSIAALNNRYGGTLFVGVGEDDAGAGIVIGLDMDYATLKEANKDRFELHLRELLNAAYGANFTTTQLEITFPLKDGKEFCQIDVKRGKEPLYTQVSGKDKNAPKTEKFYVRSGNSSRALPIDEIPKYVAQRFKLTP
jgi:hypothetical protein